MKAKNSIHRRNKQGIYAIITGICLSLSFSLQAGDFGIGTGSVVITPELGISMAGQYYERGATGVHDDLYAKALVFEKDGKKVAVVSCDLVEVTEGITAEVRKLVQKKTGIPGSNVMINATHSHTGPVVFKEDMYEPVGESAKILSDYLKKLPAMIATAVEKANNSIQNASLFFGEGYEDRVSFNRRFYMKDGSVGWNPGVLNPGIIRTAGPIDPDVLFLYAESSEGKPLTTYVNFALHLDIVGGLEISADFPYAMRTTLGKVKGEEMLTLFGQGCCGNVNHINVKKPGPQKGHKLAADIGTMVAGEVIKSYPQMIVLEVDQIKSASEILLLPLAPIEDVSIDKARETASTFGEKNAAPFMDLVTAFKVIDVYERKGKPLDFEIQAFAIGNEFAIVGLPGEIFTELGMYIKDRSPYPHTMIVELTNGNVGYVPDGKAFIEGNYEPVSARCAPGSGELMVERVLEILNGLKQSLK